MEDVITPPAPGSSTSSPAPGQSGGQTAQPAPAGPIPSVSAKEKKADIIEKYKDLRKKYEQKATQAKERAKSREASEEKAVVQKASGYTVNDIARDSVMLESGTRAALADLRLKLEGHASKLSELRKAIEISERRLKEVHDIDAEAGALADLMATQEAKKEEFEVEISKKKEDWKREQDEYEYRFKVERMREKDAYEQKKQELEREITEKREAMRREEDEIRKLRERAAGFDEELKQAVESARQESEERIRKEEESKAALLSEQVKREKGILEYRIESLAKENEFLRAEVSSLKDELRKAHAESKEVAVKVIEGISGERSLRDVSRIAMEQAKGDGSVRRSQ